MLMKGSCYVHPALLLRHPANSEVAKLPFSNSSFGRSFILETLEERHSECFRKNLLPEVSERSFPEEASFGS